MKPIISGKKLHLYHYLCITIGCKSLVVVVLRLLKKTFTVLEPVELAFTSVDEKANVNETVPPRQAEYDLENILTFNNLPSQGNPKNQLNKESVFSK